MLRYILVFLCLVAFNAVNAQGDTLNTLFRNSYTPFELMRNDLGIYRDAKLFSGVDYHPASVANIGTGLIALCIADQMDWIEDAEQQVLTTLKSILGYNAPFVPDRNISGFFRHWIDMDTGAQAWDSEYSTIDSGILSCGALFCKKYFCNNDSIVLLANQLWTSIDWSKAIEDPDTGGIYREMGADGNGLPGTITYPFNEYIIVAWLALHQDNAAEVADLLWNNHYANTDNLPKKTYQNIEVLADNPNYFLSTFVFQLPYFLCHYYAENDQYLTYMDQARQADLLWWQQEFVGENYHWGNGAGSSNLMSGYHADAIDNNPTFICSPQIIAAFLPIFPQATAYLLNMSNSGTFDYVLPAPNHNRILWRKSLTETGWRANEVQGIDFATMLFGLATLPEHLGAAFFTDYNDFFNDTCLVSNVSFFPEEDINFSLYPNPTTNLIQLHLVGQYKGLVTCRISDVMAQPVYTDTREKNEEELFWEFKPTGLSNGIYFIQLTIGEQWITKTFIKN